MRVSNNSIQTFKRCRRLWELQYRYGLKSTSIAPALEVGSTYHEKVESIIRTGDFEMDSDPKTNAMAVAFKKYIYPQLREQFEPEVWFEYQTAGGNTIVGRYDGISQRSLLEHKSTSESVNGAYWSAIDLDEQVMTYMMASGLLKTVYTVCQKPTIKWSKNETFEQFQSRCIAWYDIDTDSKIGWQLITHTKAEIKAFESEIDAMCEEMGNCKNFYRNTNYCTRWRRMCEFAPICRNYDPNQSYVGFERREQS